MAKKKRKDSRIRRLAQRKVEKKATRLSQDRERLYALLPGGSRRTPIPVTSAAVIEIRAKTVLCPHCNGALAIDDHIVDRESAALCRVVLAHCRSCGVPRKIWFAITPPLPN